MLSSFQEVWLYMWGLQNKTKVTECYLLNLQK